jgi:hypothetical protein
MKKPIPDFVLQGGGNEQDWVEVHNRLSSEEIRSAYDSRNQQDWWQQNKRIRELLTTIEHYLKKEIKAGTIPSVRVVSWSQWAHKLDCDRATLKHPRRYHWVNTYRVRLLAMIETAKNQTKTAPLSEPIVSEIDELKKRLHNQRTQTAIWYEKAIFLEQLVNEQKLALEVQNKKIERLLETTTSRIHLFGN